jgi:hypothetical protein
LSLVWRGSSTIPVALYRFLYFRVNKEVGLPVRVINARCNNDTRPAADPRSAFIWKGMTGSETGDEGTDALLTVGYVCSYGDLIYNPSTDLKLGLDMQIGFRINGESGDVVNASILYEVIRDG